MKPEQRKQIDDLVNAYCDLLIVNNDNTLGLWEKTEYLADGEPVYRAELTKSELENFLKIGGKGEQAISAMHEENKRLREALDEIKYIIEPYTGAMPMEVRGVIQIALKGGKAE